MNWHLQKNTVAGINGFVNGTTGGNTFCCWFFFSDGGNWWGVTVAQHDWSPVSQRLRLHLPWWTFDKAFVLIIHHRLYSGRWWIDMALECWAERSSSSLNVLPNCKFLGFSVQICVDLSAFSVFFAVGIFTFQFFLSFSLPFWMHIVLKPYSSLWDLIPGIFSVLLSLFWGVTFVSPL